MCMSVNVKYTLGVVVIRACCFFDQQLIVNNRVVHFQIAVYTFCYTKDIPRRLVNVHPYALRC